VNLYEKLQSARVELQNMNIKKSGENKFAGYTYHELSDFLPVINQICLERKLFTQITFDRDMATLTVIDAEKPDDSIKFTSPMAEASLKGCHPIQNMGAVQTYQRRYLYMAAFEIVEHDALDGTINPKEPLQKPAAKQPPQQQQQPQQAPADAISDPQRKKIYAMSNKLKLVDHMKQLMFERYSVTDSKALTKKQATDLIDFLTKMEGGEVTWSPFGDPHFTEDEIPFD